MDRIIFFCLVLFVCLFVCLFVYEHNFGRLNEITITVTMKVIKVKTNKEKLL